MLCKFVLVLTFQPSWVHNLWLTEISVFTCSLLHQQPVWLKHIALPLHLSSSMLRERERGSCDWRLSQSFLSPLLYHKSLIEPSFPFYMGQTSGLTRPPVWGWHVCLRRHNFCITWLHRWVLFLHFLKLCGKFEDRRTFLKAWSLCWWAETTAQCLEGFLFIWLLLI